MLTDESQFDITHCRIANPRDKATIAIILGVASFFYILGIIGYFTGKNALLLFSVMWAIATVFLIILFLREFVHRPTWLIIGTDGLVLHFWTGRKMTCEYSRIVWVDAVQGHLLPNDGAMKIKNQMVPYALTYELAQMIRTSYMQKCSFYPMTRDQYRTGRM